MRESPASTESAYLKSALFPVRVAVATWFTTRLREDPTWTCPTVKSHPGCACESEAHIRIALAGGIAENRFDPSCWRPRHGAGDRRDAFELLIFLADSRREQRAWLRLLNIQAEQMLDFYWPAVESFVPVLIKRRTISGAEAERFILANARLRKRRQLTLPGIKS